MRRAENATARRVCRQSRNLQRRELGHRRHWYAPSPSSRTLRLCRTNDWHMDLFRGSSSTFYCGFSRKMRRHHLTDASHDVVVDFGDGGEDGLFDAAARDTAMRVDAVAA